VRLFSALYDRVIGWSRHPRAQYVLARLSFSESSFFPIPPDVMLAPMVIARPEKGWWFALLTTIASVLGGLFGYLIGYFAIEVIAPWITQFGYDHHYDRAVDWFGEWGIWVVLLAGFSPIPYKVFTIAAGAVGMAVLPFLLASTVGRGARFFLVAALMRWGGPRYEHLLKRYIDYIGWLMVVAVIVVYLIVRG
jgi:membrane protein YqaA with SNARE-associated domain